ncbi:hypothetical protein [Dyella mobilis]|uniref:NTF2 fold domain-containing protein n=1 Tax=Dyella mobilis TaxID=1849582 RepID=A0ABS2KC82_9GAMM|nr:hypothetical protein [Dyella mobilis]MBM7128781.1 hypothetical protein [Dyella mobilis]GLQ99113.1 hypothetical protein GCM10007863_35330 [Dyella mobilis]
MSANVTSPKFTCIWLVLFAALFCADASLAKENSWWSPPPQGVIRDKVAAISIARAIWTSMNPSRDEPSDEEWQGNMIAVRDGNIWRVSERKLPAGSIGGGLEIDLDARDGRVVQIVFTQ